MHCRRYNDNCWKVKSDLKQFHTARADGIREDGRDSKTKDSSGTVCKRERDKDSGT